MNYWCAICGRFAAPTITREQHNATRTHRLMIPKCGWCSMPDGYHDTRCPQRPQLQGKAF